MDPAAAMEKLRQLEALTHGPPNASNVALSFQRTRGTIRAIFGDDHPFVKDIEDAADLDKLLAEPESEFLRRQFAGLRGIIHAAQDAVSLGSVRHAVIQDKPTEASTPSKTDRRVFIVHGWDEALKIETARLVERIGLESIVLHEQRNAGRTIIEKLERHSDVGAAIILLTPDDVLQRFQDATSVEVCRARQNVIAELGFFVGLLGREKVILVQKRHVAFDLPSDFLGVGYIEVDSAGRWRLDVARELMHAGLPVDLGKVP